MASLRELEDALCEASPVERPEGQSHSSIHHQECLYYLNTYGTHLALISFYMRHDCMMEALTYLLNKVRLSLSYLYEIFSRCLHPLRDFGMILKSSVELLDNFQSFFKMFLDVRMITYSEMHIKKSSNAYKE